MRAALTRLPGRRLIPPLLRESRDFRRFFVGQTVSLVGDQISFIALPLVAVLALDADAAQMGYLFAAALVPNLLLSLHAGAWVDRRGRQTMIAADLGRAALIATIPLAYVLDLLTLAQLYVVAFLAGALSVLFFVSYSTLFAATATINFFNFVFFALFILYATRSLDVQPGVLGAVLGAGAVGGVIGSLATGGSGGESASARPSWSAASSPDSTRARAARRRAEAARPCLPLPRRVRVGPRHHDSRHQRRGDLRLAHPRPPPGSGVWRPTWS